jgi:hypothetical protein
MEKAKKLCNVLMRSRMPPSLSNEPRPSDKSSDFVLFPSDPTQTTLEIAESHCAILHAAALMTAEARRPKKSLLSK